MTARGFYGYDASVYMFLESKHSVYNIILLFFVFISNLPFSTRQRPKSGSKLCDGNMDWIVDRSLLAVPTTLRGARKSPKIAPGKGMNQRAHIIVSTSWWWPLYLDCRTVWPLPLGGSIEQRHHSACTLTVIIILTKPATRLAAGQRWDKS